MSDTDNRPADRLTGRELLRIIDNRRNEDASRRSWALGLPPRGRRYDPRYG